MLPERCALTQVNGGWTAQIDLCLEQFARPPERGYYDAKCSDVNVGATVYESGGTVVSYFAWPNISQD